MAYHHFASIEAVTRMLTFFLKPGGTLIIMDIIKAEDGSHPLGHGPGDGHASAHSKHAVAHKGGFEEHEIRQAFDAASLEQFRFRPATRVTHNEKVIKIFLAKGVKSDGESSKVAN